MHSEHIDSKSFKFTSSNAVHFVGRNKALLGSFGLAGLLLAIVYLWASQSVYEVRWQLYMAQYAVVTDKGSNTLNAEEPAALIQRLRPVTTYTTNVLKECGHQNSEGDYLNKTLAVQVVKNIPNLVEFKLKVPSIDLGRRCSEMIVSMITEQQAALIVERQAGKKDQLIKYQKELDKELEQLGRLKKGALDNFAYLAKQDKLSWLRTRVANLEEELDLSQRFPARLNAPVFLLNKPIAPNGPLILFVGVILGMLIGALSVWLREKPLN